MPPTILIERLKRDHERVLREVAELLEAPVVTSLQGKSAFPETHPLSAGSGGRSIPRTVFHTLQNADVIFDGASGIPASHGYFINSNYLELVAHKDADLEEMDALHPVNQDGSIIPILWMGNLVCSNRKQQGVMKT